MSKLKLPKIDPLNFKIANNRIDEAILARWPMDVKAADDDEETITIYTEIGENFWGDGFTARKMAALLKNLGKTKDIIVSINSPGGDFFEGVAIYNLLAEHEGQVTVKIPGLAASAASIIAMAGDEIKMAESGFMMIHNAWGLVIGNRNDMREAADTFEKFDGALADIYTARTGQDRDEIVKMLNKDTWLTGKDALEKGFADSTLPNKSVEKDDESEEKKSKAMARRSIDRALGKLGFSRNEREKIFKDAIGARDAADILERDAGYSEEQLNDLLNTIRG